jgi:uncharacterized protein YfaS (alpha-2-macroglobulin family)
MLFVSVLAMGAARRWLTIAIASLTMAACSQGPPAPERLSLVAALPKPALPSWIASISPTKNAQSLAQIRVIFGKPVTAVDALDGDGPRDVLSHLRVEPSLRGRFVVLTPRMVGFVADQALPLATRVKVTITAGLRDLSGDTLNKDLAWTFETNALTFTDLPSATVAADQSTPTPVNLEPKIQIGANAAIDTASLASHATLEGGGRTIPLNARVVPTPTPPAWAGPNSAEAFDASTASYSYELQPASALVPSTTYRLVIKPGVEPAVGNVATTSLFTGGIHTYDALAVIPTPTPANANGARFADGDPIVGLNNPIDEKTIAGNVTISPQPSPAAKVSLSGDSQLAIDPYALDQNAKYTVTIGTGLRDTFGQSFSSPQTVSVQTSNFAAGFWAPTETTLIPARSGVDVNFYATNLPGNAYRAAFASVGPLDILTQAGAPSALPSPSANWPKFTLPNAQTNKQSIVRVDVQSHLHSPYGALAYGFDVDVSGSSPAMGMVQLTNLGVFSQIFPASGYVAVQHMDDGSPVAGAHVSILNLDGTQPRSCATGTTDSLGTFTLALMDIERCSAGLSSGNSPTLGMSVTSGADVATLRLSDYSGVDRYDFNTSWASGAPASVGSIFPDRDMYQPGEHGVFTGVMYYVSGGDVHADTNASYKVTLSDPNGGKITIANVTTDAYGSFSLPYDFSKTQALGYYSINAVGSRGVVVYGGFRVAEFKPPNFKVDVAVDKDSATQGSTVATTASANYLFGAPMAGAKAHVFVTRSLAGLNPKGWDTYWFGRQWFWPEEAPAVTSDVLQRDMTFDQSGQAKLDVSVPTDLPAPLTYNVEFDATDASNLSVTSAKSFLALPADGIIGLSADTVSAAKSPTQIKVIVTDPNGKALPGRSVHLELQKMTYVSATQAQAGGEDAQESVKYDTVDRADTTSGDKSVSASLTPPDSGSYRVRANFSASTGEASATDLQIFAFGDNAADFGARDTQSVNVTLDRKTYKIGDTATAVIGSPFAKADVYVSVVRYNSIYSTVLHNASGAPRVSFKITPGMFPNAAIEAIVVRRGERLASVKPGSLDSLVRAGMAQFHIDLHDRYLKVAITPAVPSLQPGAKQSVAFAVTDADGKPAQGKVIAMAVNDAVLQLSGYRLPDLVTTIFADQPISTRFNDNRFAVTLKTMMAPAEKGYGYGGGFEAAAAGTRVRTNFKPLAYYGSAITDSSGHANVSFTLPDDLTTWRVMAVAIGADDRRFGTNDATFVAKLPLMVNPLLPQFARPGDVMQGGASIMNQSGAGNLDLTLGLSGALQFQTGDKETMKLQASTPAGLNAFRFPMVAGTPAPTKLSVVGSIGSAKDAFSVPFEIRDRATTESVIDAGAAANSIDVPVKFSKPGTVSITVANSIVPALAVSAENALRDEPIDVASEYAARLIVGGTIRSAKVSADLTALLKLQRDDGGFRYYAGARESDPFASAYALEALTYARNHGVNVDSGATQRATRYVSALLENPSSYRWCDDNLCKAQIRLAMLWALAQTGDHRSTGLDGVYAQRDKLDNASQIRLARLMLATPGWQNAGNSYADTLQQALYVTGRYAAANLQTRWAWRGEIVDAQAQMVQLLVDRKAPPDQLDGATRALLAQACHCGWPTVEGTASAMEALDATAKREPPVAMNVSATSGSTQLGGATLTSAPTSKTFTFASSQATASSIHLTASAGTLHYIVQYTYVVPNDSAGQLTAFRVIRTVSDVGATKPLMRMDLASIANPFSAKTGRTYDIGIRIAVDHPVDGLVIEDPLPAGFEAVDQTFATSPQSLIPQSDNWEISSRTIYRDRVVAFAYYLGPGVYEMHYLVRSVTPGEYRWPGARAYLQSAPEEFGRSAASVLNLSN